MLCIREEFHLAVFTNQARLTYAGRSVLSNVASGEIRESVSLSKALISAGYFPGDHIAYAVSLVNAGSTPFTGLTFSDDLGAYAQDTATLYPLQYADGTLQYYLNGVLQPTPTVSAGPPLLVTGLDIPAGGSAMLLYEAEVTEFAPLGDGAQILNTASLSGPGLTAPIAASAAANPLAVPQLTITKSVSPEIVSGNDELLYTFVIQNAGSAAEADAAVVITDTFDPILHTLSVMLDGTALSADAYSYSETTGLFATAAGQLPIPGATYTQNADGTWSVTPGVTVLTVGGTL